MVKSENFIQVEISSAIQLREWLKQNHNQKDSIWLVTFKNEIKEKYVSTQEILDEILCFGWIDGVRRKLDEKRTMQLISPRKVQHWTKTYKDRFAKLEKEGRVTDAGREAVLVSKRNGLWNFMDDVDALIKPPDFIKCLNENPPAMNCFDAFGASSKRFMLRHIKIAKTADTRAKRITEITLLAKQNKKLPGS
ncbi:MAG: YdeI/OmpD-associated family protein [Cyclobacteriaceae bacterium]|nr:YdeI/OmpD-associated family protein [Cyclobacteriaceae bacterium]